MEIKFFEIIGKLTFNYQVQLDKLESLVNDLRQQLKQKDEQISILKSQRDELSKS